MTPTHASAAQQADRILGLMELTPRGKERVNTWISIIVTELNLAHQAGLAEGREQAAKIAETIGEKSGPFNNPFLDIAKAIRQEPT